jgi:hypothetical protein
MQEAGMPWVVMKKARSSFLKKRSKKLLERCRGLSGSVRHQTKVFWFFFSKKNRFLPSCPRM